MVQGGNWFMRKWFAAGLVLMLMLSFSVMSASAAQETKLFTVVFKPGTLPADAAAIVQAAGGTVV